MSSGSLLDTWSHRLIHSLALAGVEHAVISPGSRSTPWAWAAIQHPQICCHAILDERAASFYALGQARLTGKPSLLLCTSGSAGAHYLPALVEASQAYIPLMVLTADRPLELQHCAAPQTIDQLKMFGDYVRHFFELGTPDTSERALASLERVALQAVHLSQGPAPGPIHLNVRARKPLEPSAPTPRTASVPQQVFPLRHVAYRAEQKLSENALEELAQRCHRTERGLIVVGPLPTESARATSASTTSQALFQLAEVSGFSILGEPASQLRFSPHTQSAASYLDTAEALLASRTFLEEEPADLVLHFGAPCTSSSWSGYLERHAPSYRVVQPLCLGRSGRSGRMPLFY